MNVVVPKYNTGAIFFPDPSGDVGSVFKSLDAQMLVTFDYSAVITPGLTLTSINGFTLDIQTNPQLIVSRGSIAGNRASFIVSAGVGGLTYGLTTEVAFSDASKRTDVLHISVVSAPFDGCCAPGGAAVAPIADGLQQALLAPTGVYANALPRYFVAPVAPTGPKVFDRWYNSTTGVISDYVTDGVTAWWQSLYSLNVNLTKVALFYFANTSQITFDTTVLDIFNNSIPLKSTYAMDVSVNGVRVMPMTPDGHSGDYTVNISASTITFDQPLITNDVVIFDIVEIV
jgi:hypothetical protein